MASVLKFPRRDRTSFPRSFEPPFTIVPLSTTSSPSFSATFTFSFVTDSGTSSSIATPSSSFSSTSSGFLTSTSSTSFTETVTSISSLPSSSTQNTPSATSSSSIRATSISTATQSFFLPSTQTTSTTSRLSTSPSTSLSNSPISATPTSQSFQVIESAASSPSDSASVPATAIADGTSTSVVFVPTTTASVSGKTAVASSSSSTVGFWSNKAAVAGTFTAVAVVALATLAGVILCIRKRRRESHSRDRSMSEKFASMDFDNARPYSTPSEPASHDLSHEPMNAYANRDPAFYPTHDPFVANAHNMPYAGSASLPEITYSYAQDVNNQYPYYGNETYNVVPPSAGTRSTPALLTQDFHNPFESQDSIPPRNAAVSKIPRVSPNPFSDPTFRGSPAYQPSVDSFYGAPIDESPF